MTRFALLLAVLCGCSTEPAVSAPPPEMVAAIIAGEVPPPPEESPLGSAIDSFVEQAEADAAAPRVEVEFLTAAWCQRCPQAKAKIVPWLEAKGYRVTITDASECDSESLPAKHGVTSLPAFVFRKGDESVKVIGPRYDTRGNVYAGDFAKAVEKFPPPDKNAVSFGLSIPAVSVADLTDGIRGLDQDLFGVVHVTVPKDVTWTVTKKAASVLLTFKEGKAPALRSLKYVRANPTLVSVELSPYWAEFKTDSWWPMLKTVRVEFDYSPPPGIKKTAGRRRAPQHPQYAPVPQRAIPPVTKTAEVAPEPEPTLAPLAINPDQPVIPAMRQAWLSSVAITTLTPKGASIFGYDIPGYTEGYGSGFVIRSDGYVLTNHHVIKGSSSAKVTFCNGQSRPCKVIGFDDKADIAVVKVDETDLTVMPIATRGPPVAGVEVYALGTPFGFSNTLTRGIVSNNNREIEYSNGDKQSGLIHADAPVNPGNSGGAMLNANGEAIGVCVAMHSSANRIGLAIPIAKAMDVANRLVKP